MMHILTCWNIYTLTWEINAEWWSPIFPTECVFPSPWVWPFSFQDLKRCFKHARFSSFTHNLHFRVGWIVLRFIKPWGMNICVHRLWHYREVILNKYTTLQNNTMQHRCLQPPDSVLSVSLHLMLLFLSRPLLSCHLDLKYSNPANKTYIKE